MTNPNCTSTVLVMALAPLHAAFGVEKVFVATMQAVSGAGYPGVPSLDALSNVVPYISGEEEKVESETQKMLGTLQLSGDRRTGKVVPAPAQVSAMCHRVPVIDGHTEAVSVQLKGNPAPEDVMEAMRTWKAVPQELGLPSAPATPILLHDDPTVRSRASTWSPVPGAKAWRCVGRVRRCPMLGIKFTVLGHNTERGAAGASVLNAELAYAQGRFHGTGNSR
ncbi:MAG: Asd/ArgC dimerization domain-containing protein [Planctomycetota bacterium]